MAKVAILLAVYNAEKYLEECLTSIENQSWQDWELFACNDGSKDASLSIMERYAANDQRIHILNNAICWCGSMAEQLICDSIICNFTGKLVLKNSANSVEAKRVNNSHEHPELG